MNETKDKTQDETDETTATTQVVTLRAFEIPARPTGYWTDTGVVKKRGEKLRIRHHRGSWRSNPWWGPVDGRGNPSYIAGGTYLCPGSPEGCLIFRVGGGGIHSTERGAYVGNDNCTDATSEGRLYLTVNDEPAGFGDNKHSLYVTIERVVETDGAYHSVDPLETDPAADPCAAE